MGKHVYRIEVAGALGPLLRQAFAEFEIASSGAGTALTAALDQAELFDALHRVESLALELRGLQRVAVPVRV